MAEQNTDQVAAGAEHPTKTGERTQEIVQQLSGRTRAAILLVALGSEFSAKILPHLNEVDIEAVTSEVANLGTVDAQVRKAVVEEFFNLMLVEGGGSTGGFDSAMNILEGALGSGKARDILDRLKRTKTFQVLDKVDSTHLLNFLQHEHPQTIAFIVVHLDPKQAANILLGLREELRPEVVRRIATMGKITPDVMTRVEKVLEQFVNPSYEASSAVGGTERAAEILNRVDKQTESSILGEIEESDPDLAICIKNLMFVFDDIPTLDDRAIQTLLQSIDSRDLALALRACADETKEKFLKNMSSRASESLREEMEYMGPVRVRDVEDAQHRILDTLRRLEEEGTIVVGDREGGDLIV